ncbi:MAG: hypothetical protein SWH61_15125 [Thermodesulfobacteriota bacterium]|nr:hypothetical protein [Thermodesulfobacteriota bacterium]
MFKKKIGLLFLTGFLCLAGVPIGPEVMAMLEIQGLLAYALPDKEHTALDRVYGYAGEDVKTTIQKYISENFVQNFWGSPDILDYRFTNEALLGLFFDDNFTHIDMIAASMGFMYNGAVAEKAEVLTGGQTLFVPTDSGWDFWRWHVDGPLYKWADFDEVARPGDPLISQDGSVVYTTFETEMSRIRDLAQALYCGPTNLVEWYFPVRKMVDMMAAITDYGAASYGLNCLYPSKVPDLPQIAFVGGEGLLGSTDDVIPGANHMDPMFISANTTGFKPNPVIGPLLDFVENNLN